MNIKKLFLESLTKHDNPVLSHYLTTNGLDYWCFYLELELGKIPA